jgi:ABC-type dipeptide/oligopeptide/nickel transport system permease subunit
MLMPVADTVLSFPGIILAIAISAVLRQDHHLATG